MEKQELLTDDLIRLDVNCVVDDENFFVFEEVLDQVRPVWHAQEYMHARTDMHTCARTRTRTHTHTHTHTRTHTHAHAHAHTQCFKLCCAHESVISIRLLACAVGTHCYAHACVDRRIGHIAAHAHLPHCCARTYAHARNSAPNGEIRLRSFCYVPAAQAPGRQAPGRPMAEKDWEHFAGGRPAAGSDEWRVVDGPYDSLWAMNMPYGSEDTCAPPAPPAFAAVGKPALRP